MAPLRHNELKDGACAKPIWHVPQGMINTANRFYEYDGARFEFNETCIDIHGDVACKHI